MFRHRGTHVFDAIEVNSQAVGISDFVMPWGQSLYAKRYYVDPTHGSDSNTGRGWNKAFASFEAGIDACRFDLGTTDIADDKAHRAFLFLAPGHYNEGTELLFSGYNITVVGSGIPVPGKDYGTSFNYDGSSASVAAMAFSGSGIELCNVHIFCDAALPALYLAGGDGNYLHDIVIECDGTNCTYGIQADSMKGSRIERVFIRNAKTAGIYVAGGADHYAIDGHIQDCSIWGNTNGAKGIHIGSGNVVYNFWLDHNRIQLEGGSSDVGVHCEVNAMVVDNYISVPTSADPILHSGGDQYVMGNHTAAGATNVDPEPAAG